MILFSEIMNKTRRNLLAMAGVISTVLGITWAIPSILQEKYTLAVISVILIIGGLILLAISFGE